jgi:ribonuclease HI
MSSHTHVIFADGLTEPNPHGVAAWGWVLTDSDGRQVASDKGGTPPTTGATCNATEYTAMGKALRHLSERLAADPKFRTGYAGVVCRSDSQLLVNQILGTWATKQPHLQRLQGRCRELIETLTSFGPFAIEWVRREQNDVADRLSREAYRDLTGRWPPERRKATAA